MHSAGESIEIEDETMFKGVSIHQQQYLMSKNLHLQNAVLLHIHQSGA